MPENPEPNITSSDVPPGGGESPDDIEVVELDPRLEFGVGIIGDDEDDADYNKECANSNCDTNSSCC